MKNVSFAMSAHDDVNATVETVGVSLELSCRASRGIRTEKEGA